MVIWNLGIRALCLSLAIFSGGLAHAQSYPSKTIRLITTAAGGGTDYAARLVAQALSGPLGQQVIVDNRASGIVAADIVSRSAPDGYTLTIGGSSVWTYHLLRKAPYDILKDFAPVTGVSRDILIVVVHPTLGVNSIKELIALAKAKPGGLNYATGEIGSPPHLAAELFKMMAGVDIVRVNYKGTGAVLNDVMGGQVQLTFAPAAPVLPLIKAGRLRSLAVTGAGTYALAPDLPTVSASGLPGYEATQRYGIFAPAKTPPAIVGKLNEETVRGLARADIKERFLTSGSEVATSTPDDFGAAVKSDIVKWGKVIKDAKITIQ